MRELRETPEQSPFQSSSPKDSGGNAGFSLAANFAMAKTKKAKPMGGLNLHPLGNLGSHSLGVKAALGVKLPNI